MILIAPYAQKLADGVRNPKNYPFWKELIPMLPGPLVQVGTSGEEALVPDFRPDLSVAELRGLLKQCQTWVSCDSFLQHLGWDEGVPGVVLWGVSDPLIFGHPENVNLLKSRDYLAPNQFLWWSNVPHRDVCFVSPEVVAESVLSLVQSV
jgi:ADP-heptose:LPS heptosyltransferase